MNVQLTIRTNETVDRSQPVSTLSIFSAPPKRVGQLLTLFLQNNEEFMTFIYKRPQKNVQKQAREERSAEGRNDFWSHA